MRWKIARDKRENDDLFVCGTARWCFDFFINFLFRFRATTANLRDINLSVGKFSLTNLINIAFVMKMYPKTLRNTFKGLHCCHSEARNESVKQNFLKAMGKVPADGNAIKV